VSVRVQYRSCFWVREAGVVLEGLSAWQPAQACVCLQNIHPKTFFSTTTVRYPCGSRNLNLTPVLLLPPPPFNALCRGQIEKVADELTRNMTTVAA
jgi:hypothetical protein